MIRTGLFLLLILLVSAVNAQDIERVRIEGTIHVPSGEDAEGISVYNISSQKGTVTDAEGKFKIEVAENDRLQIFALQYQTFVVVIDKGITERKQMRVYVNPAITQLEEVVVRPYDLLGNIQADVKRIPVYTIEKDWDLSYKALEYDYNFVKDFRSSIEGNAAEEALNLHHLQNGINFVSIFGGLANLLFPSEKVSPKQQAQKEEMISNNIQQRFSQEFIQANFKIPKHQAADFLFYVQENGLDTALLKPENELELLRFLDNQSKEYNKRIAE